MMSLRTAGKRWPRPENRPNRCYAYLAPIVLRQRGMAGHTRMTQSRKQRSTREAHEKHTRSTRGAHEANALSPPCLQVRTTPAIRQVRGRYKASLLSRPASRHHVDHQDRHVFRHAWILRSATTSEVTPPPATPLD